MKIKMMTETEMTAVTAAPDWQLDELRARRNQRLAEAENLRQEAWADYNRALEALSRCTMCERSGGDLVPWSGERLCWDCTDKQLDLLAMAMQDQLPGPRAGTGS
jgi:hypothetical protein